MCREVGYLGYLGWLLLGVQFLVIFFVGGSHGSHLSQAIITVADEAKVDWHQKVEFEWEVPWRKTWKPRFCNLAFLKKTL